ncbi:MAG: hypothetical protein U1D66_03300 [Erythrobacter sp.]|nr:hypothetical protein [Erythrobacter sp.]
MTFSLTAIVNRKSRNEHGSYDYSMTPVSHDFINEDQNLSVKIRKARVFAEFLSPESSKDFMLDLRHSEHDLSLRDVFSPKEGAVIFEFQDGLSGDLFVTFLAGSDSYELVRAHMDEALHFEHLFVEFGVGLSFSLFEENELIARPVTRPQFLNGVKQLCAKLETPDLVRRSVP